MFQSFANSSPNESNKKRSAQIPTSDRPFSNKKAIAYGTLRERTPVNKRFRRSPS
ncbi:hypothetical protein [Argonema galeatum]|uniref:hypothetical protein n=1 Tax=Argonema galeatum TaxID=2942762 RepID=UPI0020122DE8|nr:hypothetical protein [Argonema galeatum]MCL1466598.1 hypothetical protein [Argonema galeatum A003/A1]